MKPQKSPTPLPDPQPHTSAADHADERRKREAVELYIDSWACQVDACEMRFLTVAANGSFRSPDTLACPQCHVVGRLTHWRVKLPTGTRLKTIHPWSGSRRQDTRDARLLAQHLNICTPRQRAVYESTGIVPWDPDGRPPSDWPARVARERAVVASMDPDAPVDPAEYLRLMKEWRASHE